ncbi:hypothetical protein SASPL_135714 [Salvia splendens]|uniref:ER lumen protein retaining receptor n=1 Tax=Salvia splendens TaxID=180675 RepID=A0A8X8WYM9_SALSN|nr:hypothetical protein SASPL_135714 [Salvia splendens]
MEGDIHTVLDFLTLCSTLWVVYMMRFKLKSTYIAKLDNMPLYYVVIIMLALHTILDSFVSVMLEIEPLKAILSLARSLVNPHTSHVLPARMLWAFAMYLVSISVLPQLKMVQNAKIIEPFTAHYVFALGIARFLGFAPWIIKVRDKRCYYVLYESGGRYLFLIGNGYIWLPMMLLAETVQTFILADFCYYYIKG